MKLTFVVGTGRCGSTLLSRILHAHPQVLSLNEFLTPMHPREVLPPVPVDGRRFWELLSAPSPFLDGFVRKGLQLPEQLYPYRPGDNDVPGICHMTLPLLTDDPDGLCEELAGVVPSWPLRPAPEHYRALFALLAERFDRRVVVERSGMSLPLLGRLGEAFPEARFVHLFRQGPDAALSMSRHPAFRRIMMLNQAACHLGLGSFDQLTDEHVRNLPPDLAQVAANEYDARAFMAADLPLEDFGAMWSSLIVAGSAALARLEPDRWTSIGYESLVAEPGRELARLAEFVGAHPSPQWLKESCSRIDPSRAGSASQLPAATLSRLRAACEPGAQALAQVSRREVGRRVDQRADGDGRAP